MRSLVIMFGLIFGGSALASARIVHPWNYVKLEAGRAQVEARTSQDGSRLALLEVKVGGRSANAPADAMKKVPSPRLNSIQIMWNCDEQTGAFDSQEFIDGCEILVSMEYDTSEEGRSLDAEMRRNSFVFKRGSFVEVIEGL